MTLYRLGINLFRLGGARRRYSTPVNADPLGGGMKLTACTIVLVFVGGCATASTNSSPRQIPSFSTVPTRPDYANSDVARRGWLLYQNVAAREIALGALPSGALSRVSGVVSRATSSGFLVRFCGIEDGQPVAYYDVDIPGGSAPARTPVRNDPPLPLIGADLAIWRAQTAWLPKLGKTETCASESLTIAFPTEDGRGWFSYLVPMPDSPGFMQLGGFHRLRLDASGESVIEEAQLFSECRGWRQPADVVGFAISQVKHRVPPESYVYSSLFWDLPLFIGNAENDNVWAVDDGGVHDVSDRLR